MELILFFLGGCIYSVIEILWRGYTHWTMYILAGICFVIMGLLNEYEFKWKDSLIKQVFISATIITAFEFVVGCIVNIYAGWHVWDYSDMPLNILGQVCLPFYFVWVFLSVLGILMDDWFRYGLYILFGNFFPMKKRKKPQYSLWRDTGNVY